MDDEKGGSTANSKGKFPGIPMPSVDTPSPSDKSVFRKPDNVEYQGRKGRFF